VPELRYLVSLIRSLEDRKLVPPPTSVPKPTFTGWSTDEFGFKLPLPRTGLKLGKMQLQSSLLITA